MLDLDEFTDAIENHEFALADAMDGLRRWQRFLDTHLHRFADVLDAGQELHAQVDVKAGWRDFPPTAIDSLAKPDYAAFTDRAAES